ncbi:MAG: GtrA family protein [Bryobacterales bacterium]|nr:GtrA family protein [Bryobacterales bacterium]
MKRWLRFNAVGLAGIVVQLAVLTALRDAVGLHYLAATALAVETAVLHNFFWHWKWTWADRGAPGRRLLHFQCTTGLVSVAGNVAGMSAFAGWFGMPLVAANLLAIACVYLFNFVVADRYVFRLR